MLMIEKPNNAVAASLESVIADLLENKATTPEKIDAVFLALANDWRLIGTSDDLLQLLAELHHWTLEEMQRRKELEQMKIQMRLDKAREALPGVLKASGEFIENQPEKQFTKRLLAAVVRERPEGVSTLGSWLGKPEELVAVIGTFWGAFGTFLKEEGFRHGGTPEVMNIFFHQEETRNLITWEREVFEQPENLEVAKVQDFLHQLNATLDARESPSRSQLLRLQSLVRHAETTFFDGERLRWESIRGMKKEGKVGKIDPNFEGKKIVEFDELTLQGHTLIVKNLFVNLGFQGHSKTVCKLPDGREVDFELPYLLHSLKQLSQEYPSLLEEPGKAVDFHELARKLEGKEALNLQKEIHQRRYERLLDELELDNKAAFQDFPKAVAKIFSESNLMESKKTPQGWIEEIERLEFSSTENDQYKFLVLVKMFSRTRKITSKQPLSLHEFSGQLLGSTEKNDLKLRGGDFLPLPAIQEISEFFINIQKKDPKFPDDIADTPGNVLFWFDQAEREFLTSPYVVFEDDELQIYQVVPRERFLQGNGDSVPTNRPPLRLSRLYFDEKIIREYRRLKEKNAFFREFLNASKGSALKLTEIVPALFGISVEA